MLLDLRDRFARALQRAGASGDGSAVFDELVARHGEPHRCYHTLEHVGACLGWLDWYGDLATRPAEVALALWFHDAVYDPRASDNERQSALLARDRLAALGVGEAATERIAAHILATADHDAREGDTRLVVDLDLTILGASPAVFDDFECRIRREYAHVPEDVFRAGRRRVLEGFMERPAIYGLAALRELLENGARSNLARRVAALAGPVTTGEGGATLAGSG